MKRPKNKRLAIPMMAENIMGTDVNAIAELVLLHGDGIFSHIDRGDRKWNSPQDTLDIIDREQVGIVVGIIAPQV
jgi:isopentenyl phosphate kinase